MSNSQSGDFDTKYGVIHARNPGPFEGYDNINTYAQTDTRSVQLQGPALRAFKAAEQRITPRRLKRKGKTRFIFVTGHGYRSYDLQKALYDTDHQRYADPDLSNHVEALAVDVDQGTQPGIKFGVAFRLRSIRKALEAEGFIYGVDGEPWHASFRLSG